MNRDDVSTMTLEVIPVPAFKDNYLWLVRSPVQPDAVVAVDPGDALPIIQALHHHGLTLAGILVTHHHPDHVGGITSLLAQWPVPVFGPASEDIPGAPQGAQEGDTVGFASLGLKFRVLDVPGHTAGHVAYLGHGAVFCGDVLFSAGCGRLLGGTAGQMTQSLRRLSQLPADTRVYCSHEYTLGNLRFALMVEPDNMELHAYSDQCRTLRAQGLPTLPTTIGLERQINPFLRLHVGTVKQAVALHAGHAVDSETEIFAALRDWKNHC